MSSAPPRPSTPLPWLLIFTGALAMAAGAVNGSINGDRILPRPPRKQRRPPADRGLPADNELATLATEYLTRQRKHWPDLAAAGLLPEPTRCGRRIRFS